MAPACPARARTECITQTEAVTKPQVGAAPMVFPGPKLLARVFRFDVTVCPSCSGHMKVSAASTRGSTQAFLTAVGLPARTPPFCPSYLDRQLEFDETASAAATPSPESVCPNISNRPLVVLHAADNHKVKRLSKDRSSCQGLWRNLSTRGRFR
jgi:hypothetical protein